MTQRGTTYLAGALLAISALVSAPLIAQTHKVAKPEDVIRAVGIYEWTGDMAKPNASRLIPITLFVNGKLEDAGVYLARPVPLALLPGNLYELDQAGVSKGSLDLLYAHHLLATDTDTTTYDDGWFGYARFIPPVIPKKSTSKPSSTLAVIDIGKDGDTSKPHFSSKSASQGTGGSAAPDATPAASTPAGDPDRPTMKRHADTSDPSASTKSSSSSPTPDTPAADPDRPTMKRHPNTTDQTASTGSGSNSGDTRDAPPDDADRPTLRRRSPTDAAKAKTDQANVVAVGSLNDDPNRPMLHRGKPSGVPTETDFPKLSGLPGELELHQMVAVSDPANRSPHDFARGWDDEAEHQAILGKMQAAARLDLSAYEAANGLVAPAATAKPDTRRLNSKLRRASTPDTAPVLEPLVDEQLKGYTLSYGGAATYVYSAHTNGDGSGLRYVTLVAQVNMQGEPEIALKSVTDAAHLDRIARMRLIDVVDAEASNRASLLFELRGHSSRQFALYRVIGARAEQTFLTGTTQ